jgi:hypothetical protein
MDFRKVPREKDLITLLQRGEVGVPPLVLARVEVGNDDAGPDAVVAFRWGRRRYTFAVECHRLSTPKAIAAAVDEIRRKSCPPRLNPLVLVPYLSEERLGALERDGVSGLDLCGNGVLVVPGQLLVYRTGFPNRFRGGGTIKNVYRKDSSVVARLFLLKPAFGSVSAALAEINRRQGEVTLATVSKVCAQLDEDLVLERKRDEASGGVRLRLLQPDKLLDLLAQNYTPPEVTRSFTGKTALAPEALRQALGRWQETTGGEGRAVLTGACSVDAYAVMAREPVQTFYCSDLDGLLASLGGGVREATRFANVTLLETRDGFAYFDRRPGLVASPVQTYLELAAGDKRDRETAGQVRRVILDPLGPSARAGGAHGPTDDQPA